jgi:hypothetical protein
MISNRQRRWTLASPLHLKLYALVIESDANCPPRKLGQHHLSSRAPRGICCLRPEGVFTREVGCPPKESPWAEHTENAAPRQRAVSTVPPHRSAFGQHHLSSRAPRGICCLRPEGVFTREVGCPPKESPWAEHNENAATRQRALSTAPQRMLGQFLPRTCAQRLPLGGLSAEPSPHSAIQLLHF